MKNSNRLPIQRQKEIADRLKTLRTTAGYTQEYIAKKMDITETTYRIVKIFLIFPIFIMYPLIIYYAVPTVQVLKIIIFQKKLVFQKMP